SRNPQPCTRSFRKFSILPSPRLPRTVSSSRGGTAGSGELGDHLWCESACCSLNRKPVLSHSFQPWRTADCHPDLPRSDRSRPPARPVKASRVLVSEVFSRSLGRKSAERQSALPKLHISVRPH